mmetsp:Transcript_25217/g.37246  ORF Transcript_25217/g.37246 Transcript_25217/m.37246 type:complete len:601 (-) Transcript_25217:77-1879(-)
MTDQKNLKILLQVAAQPTVLQTTMAYSRTARYSRIAPPPSSSERAEKSLASYRNRTIAFLVGTVAYTAFLYSSGGAGHYLGDSSVAADKGMMAMKAAGRKLQWTTWNIAAINNNPFEYWITYNDEYEQLMKGVESFLENPGDKDIAVKEVFSEEMFTELDTKLQGLGWASVKTYWDDQYKDRKIVSQFMKDPLLGSKRLASMPDRITNTINLPNNPDPVCRPTVINQYDGDLSTQSRWWSEWKRFMFEKPVPVKNKQTGEAEEKRIVNMLQPIKKAKYPDITEQEEKDSLPLQTMCGAIFDAILVHMMNTVSEPAKWQDLKRTMVSELNKMKFPHTLQILQAQYSNSDVIALQEVSSNFVDSIQKSQMGEYFHVISPKDMDSARDQNSVLLLSKASFPGGATQEITSEVEASFPAGESVPVAKGDILAITATHSDGVPFVIASFHGDTNGLATKPVLTALVNTIQKSFAGHELLFGLDANTYEHAKPNKQQSVVDWGRHYVKYGLTSCWGDTPNPSNYTTFNARTYLQPQLNKACKQSDKREKGDVNPKDFIIFKKKHFQVLKTWKDNSGEGTYTEDMAFPTLTFPSDHAILSTIVQAKE